MSMRPTIALSLLLSLAAGARAQGNKYHDCVANESKEKMDELQKLIDAKAPGMNERGQGGQTPLMMGCLMV